MFTENMRFFGQILHPQWPAQTSKMGPKNGLGPLGVKNFSTLQDGLGTSFVKLHSIN
jgi:hypothetical protein